MHFLMRMLLVGCFSVLLSCVELPSTTPPYTGDTWVILSPTAPGVFRGSWTPIAEQVLAARTAAKQRIEHDLRLIGGGAEGKWRLFCAHQILHGWSSYRLQAYGTTREHRQVIRLNFVTFDVVGNDHWNRNELVIVSDGGPAFWQADYDPASGSIVWW